MDAATDPSPPAAPEPAPTTFSNDYWGNINTIYQPAQSHDPPFGIGWDHPVFHHDPHQQPASHSAELYATPQPGWHQHSQLQHSAVPEPQQNYELQNQYRLTSYSTQQQPQQQANATPFEQPPSNSPYPPYGFDTQNYYQNPLTSHSSFEQQAPVELQRVALQNVTENSLEGHAPVYASPNLQNIQPRPISFTNDFAAHPSTSSYHNTIDPQFLTAARHQSAIQSAQSQRNAFVAPADLERPSTVKDLQVANGQFGKPGLLPAQNASNASVAPQKQANNGAQKLYPGIVNRSKSGMMIMKRVPILEMDPKKLKRTSSESDSSDSEVEEPPEQSPLPPSRPTDPDGAIKYDAMKIVWFPRNRQPSAPAIRNAMTLFSDLVKGVREIWKARSEALKAAENQNQEDKIPAIKKDVIMQRRFLDLIIEATLTNGHPSYVRRFGEHPMIVSALYSFLLDRHTAADSDGPLTVNILKLMTKFVTMDQAMLEKTKNDKILVRFIKKGGDTIKKFAQTILDNAASATKAKTEPPKPVAKPKAVLRRGTPIDIPYPHVVIRNPPSVTGQKRVREPEENAVPAPKRVVSPANAKPVTKPLPATTATTATTAAKPRVGTDTKPAPQNGGQAVKPKANIVTPKPTPSLFSSLMSASKRPGTSNAARAAAAAAAAKEKVKVEQQTPKPPPRPAFSFAETLADLSKPKDVVVSKPAEELPPETEEERAKRLRKEERRKLRVTWKPDDSLVQVRLFTHDPEEEIGRDDSAKRDVIDLAGEGRTLKMHRGLEDLDDEDDDDFLPYHCPSEIDFAVLDSDDRARHFIKAGGDLAPKSPAKEDQDQRETTTLSVFYTSPDDIPPTPKEALLDKEEDSYEPADDFGQPNDHVMSRSAKYFAAMAAFNAKTAAATTAPPAPIAQPAPAQAAPVPAQMDINSLLKVLQQNQLAQAKAQQPQPQAQPQTQPNISSLENIFNQFRDPNQAALPQNAQLPQAATAPAPIPAAAAPPNPALNPAAQTLDWQKLLNVMSLQQQMQPAVTPPPTQAAQGPDLASVLAQLNPGMQQQQQQTSHPYGADQQQAPEPYENPERKRYRESGGRTDGDDSSHGHSKRFRANGEPTKPKKHPKSGLYPCRFWKEGKCIKGSDCTYKHDDD